MKNPVQFLAIKIILFPLLVISFLFVANSCNDIDDLEKQAFREIAWESLTDQARETVTHGIDEAKVNLNDTFRPVGEPEAESVPAVSVEFNTVNDAALGPIIIFIDRESKEILGQAPRF